MFVLWKVHFLNVITLFSVQQDDEADESTMPPGYYFSVITSPMNRCILFIIKA